MVKCPDCGGPRTELLTYHHVDCPEVTRWLLCGGEILSMGRLKSFQNSQFVVWVRTDITISPWFSCPQIAVAWAREWMQNQEGRR